jgi:6,7-dimethyl-8-ribityllumazine synthase
MAIEWTEGDLDARGLRVALVVSRFNDAICANLLEGARDALVRHGATESDLAVIRVPGSWELPQAASRLAKSGSWDAVVALGALVRGDTPHFDYIASATAKGLAEAATASGVPVMFGVLTTDTLEQAMDRAGGKAGNKGWDAALAAIEMVRLYRRIDGAR